MRARRSVALPLAGLSLVVVTGLVVLGLGLATPAPPRVPAPRLTAPSVVSTRRPPFRVVAFGDSVPSGSTCGCTSFVSLVGNRIGQALGRGPVVDNLAVDGSQSSDILSQVSSGSSDAQLRAADLVIVEVGANDFSADDVVDPGCQPVLTSPCFDEPLAALEGTLGRVLDAIQDRPGPADRVVVLLGYWNVFLDGAVGRAQGPVYVAGSADLTARVNGVAKAVASRHGAVYADVYTPFEGASGDPTDKLLDDGDHPNQAGHDVLATAVVDAALPAYLERRGR